MDIDSITGLYRILIVQHGADFLFIYLYPGGDHGSQEEGLLDHTFKDIAQVSGQAVLYLLTNPFQDHFLRPTNKSLDPVNVKGIVEYA